MDDEIINDGRGQQGASWSPGVPVSFTFTEEEYYLACRESWSVGRRQLASASIGFLVLVAAVATFYGGMLIVATIFAVLGAMNLVVVATTVAYMRSVLPRRGWVRLEANRAEQTYEFDPQGVGERTAVAAGHVLWGAFAKVAETPNFYIFHTKAGVRAILLPRRAFGAPAEEQRFRELVRASTVAELRPDKF